jgi:hypothetical protein
MIAASPECLCSTRDRFWWHLRLSEGDNSREVAVGIDASSLPVPSHGFGFRVGLFDASESREVLVDLIDQKFVCQDQDLMMTICTKQSHEVVKQLPGSNEFALFGQG